MRRIQEIGYAVSLIVKIKSDFYSENRYAAYELGCAVSNFNIKNQLNLLNLNAPY